MSVSIEDNDLKIIKQLELQICKEIDRICNKHNIRYSLGYGTLLGAVRHQGYIPWDDDIDLMMIYSEYYKFLRIASKELNSKYEIVDYEHNTKIGEPFTKIMLKDTVMLEEFAKDVGAPCGVFVDIFPFDNCPKSSIKKFFHQFENYQLRKRIMIASNYSFNKRGIKHWIYMILKLFSKNKKNLIIKYRKNQRRYNSTFSSEVVALGANFGYKKNMMPSSLFDNYIKLKFEDSMFSCIEDYDYFLKRYYGEYMIFPSIEKRTHKHSLIAFDISNYGGSRKGT